jgi:hypothetical protein
MIKHRQIIAALCIIALLLFGSGCAHKPGPFETIGFCVDIAIGGSIGSGSGAYYGFFSDIGRLADSVLPVEKMDENKSEKNNINL